MEIVFKDLDSLKKAVADCGLEFREGQKTYRWYGRWMNDFGGENAAYRNGIKPEDYGKCEHAIGVPKSAQAYEIGVVKNPNGPGYVLVVDFWNGGYGLEALAGKDCTKLAQAYGVQVNRKTLTGMGFQVTKKVLKDGTVRLHCTR